MMRAVATILLVAVLGQAHAVEVPTNDAAQRCAVYPEVAHYSGHGNPNEVANFICKR